jgi:ABC-type transport system substrate-binding protein
LRNIAHYCSEPTQVLLERARSTIDPAARVAAYNEVDAAALGDLPVVPLYQKPSLLVTRSSLQGPRPSVGSSTDLWNVASWTGMARITVAVDSEPDLIDPVGGSTGGQAMVTGVLYPGLFVLTPELDYLPLLVESAETIIGGS